jgi:Domain of unknown function (DUF4277)
MPSAERSGGNISLGGHSAPTRVYWSNFWQFGRISSPEEEPLRQLYRSQILDHLGLVAVMFDGLGLGEVLGQATQQNPEMRIITVGNAVKAMVLNGLGFVIQQLYRVPQFFPNKP